MSPLSAVSPASPIFTSTKASASSTNYRHGLGLGYTGGWYNIPATETSHFRNHYKDVDTLSTFFHHQIKKVSYTWLRIVMVPRDSTQTLGELHLLTLHFDSSMVQAHYNQYTTPVDGRVRPCTARVETGEPPCYNRAVPDVV
ncbi:hypothetical protein M378DRAFT_11053 [Amanita muscaria Koide BX008]|uniref:Uncharacterized protein n=1 Tax=Amanita muscaria (strain Koide BX008) TaxID=946122 RepID=A0A0C2X8X4_AMAMK|nr:hypothetical protein M378DRAFT_11053 [Amanita muscaria Koide BX008]